MPVAVTGPAKAVIDETFPYYVGVYNGKGSDPQTREAIEGSDCLLSIGYRPIDGTSGDFTASLPADTIRARGHSVDIGEDNYQAVTLKEVLRAVTDAVPQVTSRSIASLRRRTMPAAHADGSAKLTQAAYWETLQGYLRSGDVLLTDNGTSYAIFGFQLPPKCTVVASVIWGSIGYSVGALLGTLTAAPERRHLLFIGDGSFQETAQELSTMLRHDCKPVIFLINNGGYTIERGYMGKTSDYNDVARWAYAELPKVFRPDTTTRSFVVKTVADLESRAQRAERQPDLHRVRHGSPRRSRRGHPQQQQRRRARLRAARPATPRQRAAPARDVRRESNTAPHVRRRREGPSALWRRGARPQVNQIKAGAIRAGLFPHDVCLNGVAPATPVRQTFEAVILSVPGKTGKARNLPVATEGRAPRTMIGSDVLHAWYEQFVLDSQTLPGLASRPSRYPSRPCAWQHRSS